MTLYGVTSIGRPNVRRDCRSGVAAAIATSAIHRFIDSFVLATILQLVLLAAVVASPSS
jgi:hypothetical protein